MQSFPIDVKITVRVAHVRQAEFAYRVMGGLLTHSEEENCNVSFDVTRSARAGTLNKFGNTRASIKRCHCGPTATKQ